MLSLEKAMQEMQTIARKVGAMQLENLGRLDLEMDRKTTSIDLVTEIDRRSDDMIVGYLRQEYPTMQFWLKNPAPPGRIRSIAG